MAICGVSRRGLTASADVGEGERVDADTCSHRFNVSINCSKRMGLGPLRRRLAPVPNQLKDLVRWRRGPSLSVKRALVPVRAAGRVRGQLPAGTWLASCVDLTTRRGALFSLGASMLFEALFPPRSKKARHPSSTTAFWPGGTREVLYLPAFSASSV